MSMASVTADTTAGGVLILAASLKRGTTFLANTGSVTAYLKMDGSATALTASNGHPLAAGEKLILTPGHANGGTDLTNAIKGITASGSTTITVQDTNL